MHDLTHMWNPTEAESGMAGVGVGGKKWDVGQGYKVSIMQDK